MASSVRQVWIGNIRIYQTSIMSLILDVFLLIAIMSAVPTIISSSNGNCTTNADCALNQCCLLGPSRYAIPSCRPLQQKGEQCRLNADTITIDLTYPDNSRLEVKDINYILCPCANGLSCNSENGICN